MCDTFVAMPSATADGSIIFGKNSDREPNEAQALEYVPARFHGRNATIDCTYLSIPQVKETRAVLLCRPFWMWGAEMGVNDAGVVIGNEAVFTRMPVRRSNSLTGMDMLRLALERSPSAAQAVEVIVGLMADFGQGGRCGYQDKRLSYHNSFILSDAREAWVLETAGCLWAARRIQGTCAISNRLTIGEEFDRCHPAVVSTARQKGWLKPRANFNFARCYSDRIYTPLAAGVHRCRRANEHLQRCSGRMTIRDAFRILRDHEAEPYRPDSHWLCSRICAHAANPVTRNAAQTTGSLVAHLKPQTGVCWVTGTAAPCISIFKPFRFEDGGLPDIGPVPDAHYNPASLWWHHEKLHRQIILDYALRSVKIQDERDRMEQTFIQSLDGSVAADGPELAQRAFRQARETTERWIQQMQVQPPARANRAIYRSYWRRRNRDARIRLV
jgi:dipeptidase